MSENTTENPQIVEKKLPIKELPDWKIPRRTFLLLGAWTLVNLQNKIDFRWFGEGDPEISSALKREGISHVNHRMFFGSHFMSDQTLEKLSNIGTHVITGEINIDQRNFMWDLSQKPEKPERMFERSFKEDFWKNLTLFGGSGVGNPFSDAGFRSDYNWGRAFQEREMTICTAEGSLFTTPSNLDYQIKAGSQAIELRKKFYYITLATAVALDLKSADLLSRKMTRRQFLKLGRLGAEALTLGGAVHALNALFQTLTDQEIITKQPNMEVTGLYSQINALSDNAQEFLVQIQGDKKTFLELIRLVQMRNQAMSLNIWYLAKLLESNSELRKVIASGKPVINVSTLAGSGHSAAKEHFIKGPKALEQALEDRCQFMLENFLIDIQKNPGKEGEVVEFYTDILSSLSSPRLFRDGGLQFIAEREIDISTPQWLLYRTLMERVKATTRSDPNSQEHLALTELFGNVLKWQLEIDVPDEDIQGVVVGVRSNSYIPKDRDTIWRRLMASGVVPRNVNGQNSSVEIYHNVATVPYRYDNRNVGILVINKVPFPFFEKEIIPASLTSS